MKPPRFRTDDVEVTSKTRTHDGYFKIDVYELRHAAFKGGYGPAIHREIFERGHAVAVLPYDPVRDEVILIEQFRAGAYAAISSPWFADDASPWLYEAVAGIIEDGESPADVAYREAVEETGTPLSDLIPVHHYYVSPGGSSETVFTFVGCCDASAVDGVHGLDHEGEDIRPFVVSLDDAYAGADVGPFAPALIAVGTKDDIAGSASELADLLPDATVVDIPGRDHMLAVGDRVYKQATLDFFGAH